MNASEQQPANGAEPASPPKTRHRSPNYPGISLRSAVAKIQALYKADGLAASPKDAAIKHFGYANPHGEAGRVLSALKGFGLIEETSDRIKLTQRGINIAVRPEGDPARAAALRDAAIGPAIYKELLKDYSTGLPSDTTLKSELIAVKKFNPKAVDDFVRDLRDTLKFAGISDTSLVKSGLEVEDEHETPPPPAPPKTGDYVQWESQGVLQLAEPRRVRALVEDGQWAYLEGSSTGVSIKELTVVDAPVVEKPAEQNPPRLETLKPRVEKMISPPSLPPTMRSYAWALSGDFTAKLDLFGEARTEEDIDALADYVEATIKALKRSLKATKSEGVQ